MKKTHRKIYFWLTFLITATLIPVLLLYASGYRLNTSNYKLIKTGSISIETTPKTVSVLMNDELYEERTPALINDLIPNEYTITLKKDGYNNWQKKLEVKSTQTTFINHVILIKNNTEPIKIAKTDFPSLPAQEIITTEIAETISDLNLSSNLKIKTSNSLLTILDKKDNILYITKTNGDSLEINKFSKNIKDFQWNKNDPNKLLFYNDLEIWAYDYEKMQEELITRQSDIIKQAIWMDYNYIIYNEKEKIKLLELDNRDSRQCFELAQMKNIENLILDKKQQNLFWQTPDNYWKLNLFD